MPEKIVLTEKFKICGTEFELPREDARKIKQAVEEIIILQGGQGFGEVTMSVLDKKINTIKITKTIK